MPNIVHKVYKKWILLLDGETGNVCTAYNSQTNELYNAEKSLQSIIEEIDSMQNDATDNPKPVHQGNIVNTQSLVVCAAEKCNMACKYCFANSGTYRNPQRPVMSRDVFDKTLVFANEINPRGVSSIHFFGGEPLLAMSEIVRFCLKLREKCKVSDAVCPDFTMTSNGTLITEDIANQIALCGIKMCVSVDGPKEIHNANRIYPEAKGSFDDTMRGLGYLKKFNIPFAIEATVSIPQIQNLTDEGLFQYFDFFKQSGAALVGIYMDIFEEELDSRGQNGVARFMNAMVDYFFNQMTTAEKLTVVFQNVLSVAAAIVCGLPHKSECGAGLSQVFITASGEVYPCQAYYASRTDYLGTIDSVIEVKEAQHSIMSRCHERTPDECIDCVYSKICDEKCPGMRLLSTGKDNKLRTPFCFAQKELINRVLYHLSQLSDDESLRPFEQNMKSAIELANSLHIQA